MRYCGACFALLARQKVAIAGASIPFAGALACGGRLP